MTTGIKNLAKRAAYGTGFCRLYRAVTGPAGKRLFILMYHDLKPDAHRSPALVAYYHVPKRMEFEAHLRELAKHHHVVALADAVAALRSGDVLRKDSVAITFDDGFESSYTIAYPLLKKYGLPATVFLVTRWVGAETLSWWQHFREMLAAADFSAVTSAEIASALGVDVPFDVPAGATDEISRVRFGYRLEPLLWPMSDDVRNRALRELQTLLFPAGGFAANAERIVTWEQVREMADGGIEFGSHSETHFNVPFADEATIEQELAGSKREIESRIQREVVGFAYPYGKALREYVALEPVLRKLGFTYACHACSGNNSSSTNPYSLSRGALPLTTSGALINYALFRGFIRGNGGAHASIESPQNP